MNKKHLIFSAILAAAAIGASAAPISKDRAISTAISFMKYQRGITTSSAGQVYSDASKGYYVVNLKPQGWVIVSGDDTASPIIGYNTTGSLSWGSMPSNMREMMNLASREITAGARQTKIVNKAWNTVAMQTRADESTTIEPLIQVNWNQSGSFNKYCPGSGTNKALVGCVAVAMSQAMSVQRYPARPTGSVNYTPAGYSNINMNFDNERAYDWSKIMSGADNYDEAARLLYHAGVSVRMRYGAEGSGVLTTQLYLIRDALRNNFQYKNGVEYYQRDVYEQQHGSVAWTRLLLNELNAGRAIVYNGTGKEAGHSFNLDGFDGVQNFHVNWGWGGAGNGYFNLSGLHDDYQGIDFPDNHTAVIGIGTPDRKLRSVELNELSIDEKLPAGTVVADVTVNGEKPAANYTMTVRGLYQAGRYEQVPFEIRNNQLVTTEAITWSEKKKQYDFDIIVTEPGGERLAQTFTITINQYRELDVATSVKYDRASGKFEIRTKHNVSYKITNAQGATVLQGDLTGLPHFEFNKSVLGAGKNTVTLICKTDNKSKTFTIVK